MTEVTELLSRVARALPEGHPGPARPEKLELLEAEAGNPLPDLMRRIYLELADGGWGPAYGVLGVDSGHTDDLGGRLADVYRTWHETKDPMPSALSLPRSWVPFLHAGCAMHFCVETSNPDGEVLLFDPNPGPPIEQCLLWRTSSFAEFVRLWLDGELEARVWPG